LTFKVSQSGLPSNPVYFSPTQGDAYVDISGIIKLKNYDIYDSKEGFTRPLTADDVVDGLKRVVKLSDSSSVDEFPLGEVYSHPELENYLWFFNISQGEYLLETEIIGYGEPIQMRFTIIADNFVGGKS